MLDQETSRLSRWNRWDRERRHKSVGRGSPKVLVARDRRDRHWELFPVFFRGDLVLTKLAHATVEAEAHPNMKECDEMLYSCAKFQDPIPVHGSVKQPLASFDLCDFFCALFGLCEDSGQEDKRPGTERSQQGVLVKFPEGEFHNAGLIWRMLRHLFVSLVDGQEEIGYVVKQHQQIFCIITFGLDISVGLYAPRNDNIPGSC